MSERHSEGINSTILFEIDKADNKLIPFKDDLSDCEQKPKTPTQKKKEKKRVLFRDEAVRGA